MSFAHKPCQELTLYAFLHIYYKIFQSFNPDPDPGEGLTTADFCTNYLEYVWYNYVLRLTIPSKLDRRLL